MLHRGGARRHRQHGGRGGLLIGFIEIVIVALFPALSGYRDAFAFVVLILVLLVKPTGLLGEKTTEKV